MSFRQLSLSLFALTCLSHPAFAAYSQPASSSLPVSSTQHNIPVTQETSLSASLTLPADGTDSAPYPALLIAPGQGYHMELPLIKQLAEKAAQQGIATLRFDWRFYKAGKHPDTGYQKEQADLEAALAYLKGLNKIDKNQIMLAGKSLGSIVAYRVFAKQTELHSLYLLTPVCSWQWDKSGHTIEPYSIAEENYPDLKNIKRPVYIMSGNRDPLCATNMLYPFIASTNPAVKVNLFGGDHSLNIGHWKDPAFKQQNADNISAAVDATVHWMKLNLNK